MSNRTPKLLLEDIIEAGEKIQRFTKDMSLDTFSQDDKTIDAVIRNFEIIGEASGRLPKDFKTQCSEIDWERIRGFRNRIVHDYFGVDHAIVWNIIENFLPGILKAMKSALGEKS